MKSKCVLSFAAAWLLAFSVSAAVWFDAHVGDYVAWPAAADVPQGGAWSSSDAGVALGDLATLSDGAPQASLELEAEDAALDFRASALNLDEETESTDITLNLAFNAFRASSLPAVDPAAKAGAILVTDVGGAKLYYLAKDPGADANVWVASSFILADTTVAQELTVTLKKSAGVVRATYKVGTTLVASDVEVYAAESTVSTVRFNGTGRLSSLAGTSSARVVDITVDAASLASTVHLEVVDVRDRDSDQAIQPVGGKYPVPYGAHVAVSFRATQGYRLVGDGVLNLDVTSAAITLNAGTPGLVAAEEQNVFRVTPYVQHPKPTAMSLLWLAEKGGSATFEYWKDGSSAKTRLDATLRSDLASDTTGRRFSSDDALEYCLASELGYGLSPDSDDAKEGGTAPYQYRVRVTGLEADTVYRYRVTLDGAGATYENAFRTSPDPNAWRGFKFIYFSDSETQPEDNPFPGGCTGDWDIPAGSPRTSAKYFATQTEAYAANIRAAVDFGTELIVMAGDLAQKGSKQCDWDEFWRHNAGDINAPAASIPILASPGNHDYWSYTDGGNVGIRKYLSYFEYEPNQANVSDRQHELFHRVDYGPVTFLFMDACNGNDDVLLQDTSRHLSRVDADGYGNRCIAPDFNPGSEMYNWLEEQLKDAQKNSAFTFVVCHQCPYSCGYHGGEICERNQGGGKADDQTGRALRVLEPLFHKYGVDGWLCGHDEMMERSEIEGVETLPDGTEVPHKFCVWDMGIAGDGLRGDVVYGNVNPKEKYRAHVDCPEVYEDGVLVEGGKHYGHLEVTIDQTEDGSWRATFDPVYIFYSKDANGNPVFGGVRHYADKVVRISNRNAGAAPAPQPVTKTRVDVSTYVPTKMPQALLTTFWSDACSRGFAWQTDASVTETKLWLLKGEYDQDDGNTFVTNGTLVVGTCEALSSKTGDPAINGHRVHVENLESGATYSYRLGGNGFYTYGRFTVAAAPRVVRIVNFSDTQTKDATGLYKAENAVAAAVRTAGGSENVDLVICGGDLVDVSPLKNVGHVAYGTTDVPASGTWSYMYWKWGLLADILAPYFPGVPWVAVPGNHDYKYYLKTTEVNAVTTGMEGVGCGCSSFDIGNVHIVNLPYLDTWTNVTEPKYKAAFNWLDADLKSTSARWKVVCAHWGPYTTGDHSQEAGTKNLAWALAPILSSNHVDLVLQAHDHTFSKSVPYRWDTVGYTSSATDGTVLNLNPQTVRFGGELWDANPAGTYYVSSGCAGPRVAEEPDYPDIDGPKSYAKRDPKIVMGKVAVKSDYFEIGHDASSDFHQFAPASDGSKGRQTFGVLKVVGDRLSYDFYVAEEDGSVTRFDKLRVMKGDTKFGCLLMLK